MVKDFIVLDTETTGLKPGECQITEIGAIKVNGVTLEVIDTYETLVKVKGPVSMFITNLTGITKKMLKKDGIKIKKALKGLASFCGELDIYAHFASFDKKFIRHFLNETGVEFVESEWVDTIKIFKEKYPGRSSYKLNGLIRDYGIAPKEEHRALSDAMHTLTLLKMGEGQEVTRYETQESLIMDVFSEMKKVIDDQVINKEFKRSNGFGPSLSMILNDKNTGLNKEYLASVLKVNKTKIIRGLQPQVNTPPISFIGTAMDQMVEYYFDKWAYLERIKKDFKVPVSVLNSLSKSDELDVYDFIAITFGISYFRGAWEKDKENYELAIDKKSSEWHIKMFKEYMQLAKIQSSKLNDNVIFNPVFGSQNSGIKADGDFIFGNKLCEMKTSKKPSFNRDYKKQMISYILLNDLLDQPYTLSMDTVIYWNPYFDYFEEMSIEINDEIRKEFKILLDRYNYLFTDEKLFGIYKYILSLEYEIKQNSWDNPNFKLPSKEFVRLKEMIEILKSYNLK